MRLQFILRCVPEHGQYKEKTEVAENENRKRFSSL